MVVCFKLRGQGTAPRAVLFTLNVHMDHLGSCQTAGYEPGGLRWAPRMWISAKFPGEVHAAGSWTTLGVVGKSYFL